MGLVIVVSSLPSPPTRISLASSSLRRAPPPRLVRLGRWLRPSSSFGGALVCKLDYVTPKCSTTNTDVDLNNVTTENGGIEDHPSLPSGCSIPVVHLTGDVLDSQLLNLVTKRTGQNSVFRELSGFSKGKEDIFAAIPAHPEGLYALYASYFFGNFVEQVWNFAWPASLAILYPSLLPVAVVGFFTKLAIFTGAPLVGKLLDHCPRIPMYNSLNFVQAAAQLLSATMIIYALKTTSHSPKTAVLVQPWFILLVVAGAIERVAGLALGVTMERDWVVLLAGKSRPVALAQANAMLNRIDLLCETAGASLFGILLSKFNAVTCLKIACGLMVCSMPVLVILGQTINRLSSHVLDCYRIPDKSFRLGLLLDAGKIFENGIYAIRHGWNEYKHQIVLPASVASVLLCFNIALAPGALMTALLMHHGVSPSIIGGFSGLCSIMGFAATFISSSLVKRLGILKAGAAGLIFQALFLAIALVVYLTGSVSRQAPLLIFLVSIVLSRLGHMSYDVVGTQILQTGVPVAKANLIGTTEVSIASLAEFIMLGVAIVANDVSHFGFLAILSLFSVTGAALMFCQWLANPTDEQRKLFNFDSD
ncbi:solute carrier family 40 member 2, chloroplastic-like [Typha latifolia]|uniref:solute carrier family 40 member 2, chloroplastic-like n=1 Tax=Typha latifolia TaxID=4733 RepID=UPI003C2AF820